MSSTIERKRKIFLAIRESLQMRIRQASEFEKDARHEANQQSSAMQSRYDTFREEGQYVANAQAARKHQFEGDLARLNVFYAEWDKSPITPSSVRLGSLVTVADDESGEEKVYLVVPGGGGDLYNDVMVVNFEAPIARAFFGKCEGDEFTFGGKGKERSYTILEVR